MSTSIRIYIDIVALTGHLNFAKYINYIETRLGTKVDHVIVYMKKQHDGFQKYLESLEIEVRLRTLSFDTQICTDILCDLIKNDSDKYCVIIITSECPAIYTFIHQLSTLDDVYIRVLTERYNSSPNWIMLPKELYES